MKKPNVKILVAVLAVVAGVGYLIFTGISDTGVYYRTVSEVLNGANIFDGRAIRISGEVVEDTVAYDQEKLLLTFSVRDTDNRRVTMQARYEGVMPDAFKEGAEVILEGTYSQVSNLFSATTLLAKCPSKYVAEADAETGSGK